jgi:hypothetical protein
MANGYIAYEGTSAINGKPIKAIVTGTEDASKNPKTGDMEQLWILTANVKPSEALKTGEDEAICGRCPHRPLLVKQLKADKAQGLRLDETTQEKCYVRVGNAPNAIYKATYPTKSATRKVPMRLGAYGEPTALPFEVVEGLVNGKHTGYTHQWRTTDPRFKAILMASADSESEAREAQAMGWRTFRVRKAHEPLLENEIACPASKEAGYKTQCAACGLCAGAGRKAKNIAIIEH